MYTELVDDRERFIKRLANATTSAYRASELALDLHERVLAVVDQAFEEVIMAELTENKELSEQYAKAINNGDYLEVPEQQLRDELHSLGIRTCIIERDGRPMVVTRDVDLNRLQLRIAHGNVIGATRG